LIVYLTQTDTPEGDQLEILVTLVEAYEDKHYDLPPPDPIDATSYYIESRGLSHKDLGTVIK
jgi:HTH-type transcriptional regulator/antitoxin HigA